VTFGHITQPPEAQFPHLQNRDNKTQITSHLSEWIKLTTQETTGVGKDVEKKEPSCTAGENANWCSHCRKQ